ncbi:beta-1,3-galactosyltransferase, putative [Pediculus humanus corporis]|uniref:Hexosyltransferase n=1 Tax=Pediculus humanus subsp. corporis TaxID=121224 RepID=E0VPL8_PEDHC|nr:beta-1,3-galactosyltransferase, putative [Pediculus humanus corporis]EEB15324.1 beta-1,3-galactosyltransferase, putative [Pediculus humanus corporis]
MFVSLAKLQQVNWIRILKRTILFSFKSKIYISLISDYANAEVFLVVFVFSSIGNYNKRQTIRETWLSELSTHKDLKHYFVISSESAKDDENLLISVEREKHKDLLIFHKLKDSFYLLTSKLVASFGWLTNSTVLGEEGKSNTLRPFNRFKFVLKCDDDTFVRVREVINELKTVYSGDKGRNLYWGFFDGRAKVKKGGKYKEEEWNICDYYIPYALGGGYILSESLVSFIATNEKFLKKYRNEDVSVGAWLSSYNNLNRVHDTRFDTEYISRGCHQSYLVTHKHSETAMRNFHNNLKNTGHLCQREFKTRMSYNYDWQALPSKCCLRVNSNIP